jgi:tetratricopeptide (TPR) repeat protein
MTESPSTAIVLTDEKADAAAPAEALTVNSTASTTAGAALDATLAVTPIATEEVAPQPVAETKRRIISLKSKDVFNCGMERLETLSIPPDMDVAAEERDWHSAGGSKRSGNSFAKYLVSRGAIALKVERWNEIYGDRFHPFNLLAREVSAAIASRSKAQTDGQNLTTRVIEHEILADPNVLHLESEPDRESALKESAGAPAPEASGCGGACKLPNPEGRLKQKIWQLNKWIFEFATKGDIATVRKLIEAASALSELAGGGDHEEGAWLLCERSILCTMEGKHRAARKYGAQAIKMAAAVFGDKHPAYAVVGNNLAEGLIEAGNYKKAEKYLQVGLGILNTAIASGEEGAREWGLARADALSNYQRLLKETGRHEEAAALVK